MTLEQYLKEVEISGDEGATRDFNIILRQVFSLNYVKRIEDTIKKRIKIIKKDLPKGAVAMHSFGNKIIIDPEQYNSLEPKRRMIYLLHEFFHVLQNTKSFFIISKFKELEDLEKRIEKNIRPYLIKPLEVFLSGKNIWLGKKSVLRKEIIPYLILGNIDWTAIKQEGKQRLWETMRNSGVFNMSHPFWQKHFGSKEE